MNLYYARLNWGQYEGLPVPPKDSLGSKYVQKLRDTGELNVHIDRDKENLIVGLKHPSGYTSFGYITAMPNNCGLVILSGLPYRDAKGKHKIIPACLGLIRKMGYSQVLYTLPNDANYNELQVSLEKAGFVKLKGSEVKNIRSGNVISTYILNLNEKEEENNEDF